MININIYKNGFIIDGHSNYNKIKNDVVCAGVSSISQGFINFFNKNDIEEILIDEEKGFLKFVLKKEISKNLLNMLFCQFKTIESKYSKNIKILINNIFIKNERAINIEKFNNNIDLNIQLFASKKGVGSTKNGRDSNPKYLGAKLGDGQFTKAGQIIYRQRGNKIYPGKNVGQGKDHTLFAKIEGIVKYSKFGDKKKKVSILPFENKL